MGLDSPRCSGISPGKGRTGPRFKGVVIGGSAGGLDALKLVLAPIPGSFPLPILVGIHLHKNDHGLLAESLAREIELPVSIAMDKDRPEPGHVYLAPADYHLLVERSGELALSVDPKVNWARPSIDVLFESAARAWTRGVVAVILSGANHDGASGMKLVDSLGGLCVAQEPETASSPRMPRAAIETAGISVILTPSGIGELLMDLVAPEGADFSYITKEQ